MKFEDSEAHPLPAPLTSYLTSGKMPHFLEPQFLPHL